MNPDELKAQLEQIEKKKKRNAMLIALGFAVLGIIVIFGIYSAFVRNVNRERTESTQYSLFERIFGGKKNPQVVDEAAQTEGETKQVENKNNGTFGVKFTSLAEKWFPSYAKGVKENSTNIVRPLSVSSNIFEDPEYIKKYGKVNKDEATLEDMARAMEFASERGSEITDQIGSLEKQVSEYNREFDDEKQELDALKAQLANLEALEAQATQNGDPVDLSRVRRRAQIESIKQQISGLEQNVTTHQQISGAMTKQIGSLNTQYNGITQQVANYNSSITGLEQQIGGFYSEYTKLDPQVKQYLNQLKNFDLQILKTDPMLSKLSPQFLEFFVQISSLRNQLTETFDSQIKDLYAQIKFLKLQVTSFTSQKVVPIVSQLDVPIFKTKYQIGATANGIPATEVYLVTAMNSLKGYWDGIGTVKPQVTGVLFQLDANKDGKLSSVDFDGLGFTQEQVLSLQNQIDYDKLEGIPWATYVEAYDVDRDGIVELSEIKKVLSTNAGNALQKLNLTQQLDLNKDGKVTPDELQNQIVYIENQGISWEKFLAAYDLNKDGFVTTKEMKTALENNTDNILQRLNLALQLDTNKDGRVSLIDFKSQIVYLENSGLKWSDFLAAYDSNADRQITVEEMKYAMETNYGNVLKQLNLTSQLDVNKDGIVTQNEFFQQLDANKDGFVTKADFDGFSSGMMIAEFDGSITGVRDGFATLDEIRYALSKNQNSVFYRFKLKNQLDLDGDNIVKRPYLNIFGDYVVDSREMLNVADINGDGIFERCRFKDMYGNCIPEGFLQLDVDGNLIPDVYLQGDTDGDGKINPCYYTDTGKQCFAEGYSPNDYNFFGNPDYFFQLDTNGDNIYNEKDAFDPYTFVFRKTATVPIYINEEDSWRDEESGQAQVALMVDFTPGKTLIQNMTLTMVKYKIDKTGKPYDVSGFGGGTCTLSRTKTTVQKNEKDLGFCYLQGGNVSPDDYFDVLATLYGPTSITQPNILQGILNQFTQAQAKPIITYGYTTVTVMSRNSFSSIDQPASKWYYLTSTNPRTPSTYYAQRQICLNEARAYATSTGKTGQPPCYREIFSRATYYFFTEVDPQIVKSPDYPDLKTCTAEAQKAKQAAKQAMEAEIKKRNDELRKQGKPANVGPSYDPRSFSCINSDNKSQLPTVDDGEPTFINQIEGLVDQDKTYRGFTFFIKTNPKRTNKEATIEFAATNYMPSALASKDENKASTYPVTFYYWKDGTANKFTIPITANVQPLTPGQTFSGLYETVKVTGNPGETINFEFTEMVPDESTSDPVDLKEVSVSGVRSVTLMTDKEFEASKDYKKSPVNQSMYQEVSAASPTFSGFGILKQGIIFCGYDGYWPTYDGAKKRFNYTLPAAFLANPTKYGIDPAKIKGLVEGEGASAKAVTYFDGKPQMVTVFNKQVDENELCSWPHVIASFNRIVNIILKVFMPLAIGILIMVIGVRYLIAAYKGAPVKLVENKKALWRIVIGTLIILSSFVIVRLIVTTLNQQEWFGQFVDVTGK
ncbi:MAG TPA: hypothetical protein VGE63_00940 [Candidatus Paceibacterota bacterium]